jgi:NitT/TauT family transport system substrate-binding protein
MLTRRSVSLAAASLAIPTAKARAAESGNISLIGAVGVQFLPTYVVVERKLIERHASLLGVADPKVSFKFVATGAAINDAMVSGAADVGSVPAPALVVFWDKTGGRQAIRGMMALVDTPPTLLTIDPRIKTLSDYTANDRIAMATVKVSSYAIMMQMAAAQQFGWDQRFKFDPISVQLGTADIMTALLSGGSQIKSAVLPAPFNRELLEAPGVRQILSLDQILGGHGTLTALATTERFHSDQPKSYAAVNAAFREAIAFINANRRAAAEIYIKWEPNKRGLDWVRTLLEDDSLIQYTPDPHRMGTQADFIFKTGLVRKAPASWKDLFFDNGVGLDGS